MPKTEKYISKTIYQTFSKKDLEQRLHIDFADLQLSDFFIKNEAETDL